MQSPSSATLCSRTGAVTGGTWQGGPLKQGTLSPEPYYSIKFAQKRELKTKGELWHECYTLADSRRVRLGSSQVSNLQLESANPGWLCASITRQPRPGPRSLRNTPHNYLPCLSIDSTWPFLPTITDALMLGSHVWKRLLPC